jgi:hypothetical protein
MKTVSGDGKDMKQHEKKPAPKLWMQVTRVAAVV